MAKLLQDKAFKSNELKELADVGKKTLKMAEEVSDDVKKSLTEIMAQYNQIPAQARQEGVERAVRSAQKRIQSGKYNLEKKRLENTIKRMEEAVPQHDKECAGQLKQLSEACDRLYTRITDLERFLQKGKMTLSSEQFKKQLEEYQKKWEEEGKALEDILEAVKAGLKGLALKSCMYSRDPVNLSTGNFIYDKTDIKIKGEPGLLFRRFYNALETRKGVMGTGWIHNYEICILKEKNGIHLFLEDGKEEYYEENEEGCFESVGGSLGTVPERRRVICMNGQMDVSTILTRKDDMSVMRMKKGQLFFYPIMKKVSWNVYRRKQSMLLFLFFLMDIMRRDCLRK